MLFVSIDLNYHAECVVQGMLWETSLLDAEEGIRFRGHSIPELQAILPGARPGGEPLPEGLLWLLMTGEVRAAGQHGLWQQPLQQPQQQHTAPPLVQRCETLLAAIASDAWFMHTLCWDTLPDGLMAC
jgi:hypothetical protein